MFASRTTYLAILTPVVLYQLVCLCRPLLGNIKVLQKVQRQSSEGTGAESTRNTVSAYYRPPQLDSTRHDTQLFAIKLANEKFTIEIQVLL